jgi:tetratricopeptide (TPR) repeat protein
LIVWASPTVTPPKVFISYAHRDHHWCDQLKDHLGGLHHQDRLALWTDHLIRAGDEWDAAIQRELDKAAIIILIVSPAFLGSRFCQTVELRRALERHAEGKVRVIPIIAEHCDWQGLRITELQARPHDDSLRIKPLKRWRDKNEPLAAIAKEIRELIEPKEATAIGDASLVTHRTYLHQRRRTFFVGREREKQQLAERLAGGGRAAICAVAGMGGVGKTELTLQVAGDLGASAFPAGIVTVDLQGTPDPTAAAAAPLSPQAAMQRVLVQLDPTSKPPEDADALKLAFRRALVDKRLLLILDNARDAAQVEPLVPPEPVALLVTSRTHIVLEECLTLDLDTLNPGDAVKLLKEEIGTARLLDEATLAHFAELCDYLPVALLAIAGTIKTSRARTPAQLLALLEADRAKGLTGVLHRLRPSVEALALDDPDLARRFARLTVFAGDFDIEAAGFVWETNDDRTHDYLDALLARSLLLSAKSNTVTELRFRLHDLIREIATERLADDGHIAHLLHATYFRDRLQRCRELYLAGSDNLLEALALFDRERAEIVAGQAWAAGHSAADENAARLAANYPIAGANVIQLRLESRTVIAWLDAALNVCRRLGDRIGEGLALGTLGLAWAELGETRKAIEHHEQNCAIAREIGDRRGEGTALGNLGNAWADLGKMREAIKLNEQYLAIAREIGDRRGEGVALGNLGKVWAALEPREAIGYYEQALAIAREIGALRGEGDALGNLGNAWARLGETRMAIEHYEQALVIARKIGDRRGERNSLGNLGLAWGRLGRMRKAIHHFEPSLAISREMGDRRREGNTLGDLGIAWARLGKPRKAIIYYELSLAISREIGDWRGQGSALWNMAYAHEQIGDTEAALDRAKAGFVIFRAIEHPDLPRCAKWLRERGVDLDSL